MTTKHLDTTLVQAGRSKKYTQGSVNSVIQRASSLVFDTVEEKKNATRNRAKGGLFYGRPGTCGAVVIGIGATHRTPPPAPMATDSNKLIHKIKISHQHSSSFLRLSK